MTPPNDPTLVLSAVSRASWRRALLWLFGATLLRALLSSLVPLVPDETYYWLWTRHLAAGYFDHPPGIALLTKLGTAIIGTSPAGVRAGPMLAAFVTHVGALLAAWYLAGRGEPGARAACRASLLMSVVPLALLGLVLATPDAALFAASMVSLLAVERALAAPLRSRRGLWWWVLAGISLGAALVAKYTAVLFPIGLVVACLMHPALRIRFREGGPWLASLIALVLFSPVVLWNAMNNWISFRFQLGHGFGGPVRGTVLTRELELIGGQFGLASPILFGLMAYAVWVALRDGWRTRWQSRVDDVQPRRFALAITAVLPLVFFSISAARRTVEANWPALMYPSAILLLSSDTGSPARGRWWRGGVALAVAVLLMVSVQAWRPVLPLAPRQDLFSRSYGWSTLAAAVDSARHDPFLDGTVDRWVAADRYQDASALAFHLADHPTVFSLNLGGRPNQFDLWPTAYDKVRPGDGLVAVFDDNPVGDTLGVRVATWFKESRRGPQVVLRRADAAIAHRRVWLYRIATNVPARPRQSPSLSGTR
ncbi:MAG: glycosyltransferase family 39 protein [Gemmatimonadaceae bacterium]|nr:glycosyltransferase family 39 protein [Gemmatimonadaceae bacterium]